MGTSTWAQAQRRRSGKWSQWRSSHQKPTLAQPKDIGETEQSNQPLHSHLSIVWEAKKITRGSRARAVNETRNFIKQRIASRDWSSHVRNSSNEGRKNNTFTYLSRRKERTASGRKHQPWEAASDVHATSYGEEQQLRETSQGWKRRKGVQES